MSVRTIFPLSLLVPELVCVTAITACSHVSRLFASGSVFSLYQNSFRLSTWQVVDAQKTFPEANCSESTHIKWFGVESTGPYMGGLRGAYPL